MKTLANFVFLWFTVACIFISYVKYSNVEKEVLPPSDRWEFIERISLKRDNNPKEILELEMYFNRQDNVYHLTYNIGEGSDIYYQNTIVRETEDEIRSYMFLDVMKKTNNIDGFKMICRSTENGL